LTPASGGPVWGVATEDLNATILEWPALKGPAAHVNRERDVVLVVLAGSVQIEIDGQPQNAGAGEVVVIEKGASRRITAGPMGARYLTVHRKRAGLEVAKVPPATEAG
jgi:quercetin dioxygenase-like cupin family protein